MKQLIIAIILLQSIPCFSQNDYDSLRKYSYYIVGTYENWDSDSLVSTAKITGTGYFIRNEGKTFFITAKHVLAGTDELCRKVIPDDDQGLMTISLVNDSGIIQQEVINLNVKKIRDTAACNYLQNSPDIIAYEIFNPGNYKIYSIENFIPAYLPKDRGKIITFGYRDSLDIANGSLISRESIPIVTNHYGFYNNYKFYRGKENGVDSINYLVELKDSLFSIQELKGHSGSPAFIKDNKRNRFIFLGTLVGMSYVNNNLSFVKPSFIKKIFYPGHRKQPQSSGSIKLLSQLLS
ncbi:MAG: hypothetical protein ABI741_13290 [Ferruginibacter sp.]